ncbi:uncharacterized protein LOC121649173 isoform X2 [Melanotaenia boesemani]|nr:uncharacterized protein LOC121649173 isoform X2 [Melanotaenia boesemani]
MFEGADKCCREHDHCLHIIPTFTVNYGVFNPNFFTVSHCDCDQRFRQCLLGMNDSISHMVGYSFFNILQVPCFELKQMKRCTEMYWWGMCKRAKEAPYAVFKKPLPYNSSDDTSKYVNIGSNNLTSSERQNSTESLIVKFLRKSSKTERGCGLRDPPRGDTFHRRRTKGKGCKRHQKLSGVLPSQVPTVLRVHTSTMSIKMGPAKSSSLISNNKRAGKMNFRKSSSRFEQTGHIPAKVPTITDQKMPSATPLSITLLTQRLTLQLKPTPAIVGWNKTFTSHQKVTDPSFLPVRGNTSHLHCKSSLKPETASNRTTATLAKTIKENQQSSHESQHLKKTTVTPNQDTSLTLQSTVTLATPVTTKLRAMVSLDKDDKSQNWVDFYPLWNNTSQKLLVSTVVHNFHAEKSLTQNGALRNMTDTQFQCHSLKHLDDCKFKIPPLEKKYNLQNMESKATYHCDCTSRLAVEIESFKQPSILPSLLVEFVSQQCFTLPKKKNCRHKKRCFHGFSKASDLHTALKKIEEKNAAGMGILSSDKKRRVPVRLYKRCLRLEKKADIMAKLK